MSHMPKRTLLCASVALCLLLAVALHGQPAPISFPPHPRLAYTAAELAAWKADPARQGEITALLGRADGEK